MNDSTDGRSLMFPDKLTVEAKNGSLVVRDEDGAEHFSIGQRACGGYDPCATGIALISNLGQQTSWGGSSTSDQLFEFIQRYNAMDDEQRKFLLTNALAHADAISNPPPPEPKQDGPRRITMTDLTLPPFR